MAAHVPRALSSSLSAGHPSAVDSAADAGGKAPSGSPTPPRPAKRLRTTTVHRNGDEASPPAQPTPLLRAVLERLDVVRATAVAARDSHLSHIAEIDAAVAARDAAVTATAHLPQTLPAEPQWYPKTVAPPLSPGVPAAAVWAESEAADKVVRENSIIARAQGIQRRNAELARNRLPKQPEAQRGKTHWDYLLEEAAWMAIDFREQAKWKVASARKLAKAVARHSAEETTRAARRAHEEEVRRVRLAHSIARDVRRFWKQISQLADYRRSLAEEARTKELRKRQLDFLLRETERYTQVIASELDSAPPAGTDGTQLRLEAARGAPSVDAVVKGASPGGAGGFPLPSQSLPPRPSSDKDPSHGDGSVSGPCLPAQDDVGMRPASATNGDVPRRRSRSDPSAPVMCEAGVVGKPGGLPTVDAGVSPKNGGLGANAVEVVDDETTIAEAEANEERDDMEAARLASEADMPLEDLLRLQGVDVDAYTNDHGNYAASDSSGGSVATSIDEEGSASDSSSAAMETGSDTPDAVDATTLNSVPAQTDGVGSSTLAAQNDALASLGRPGGQLAPTAAVTQQQAPPRHPSAVLEGAKQAGQDSGAGVNGVVYGRRLEDAVADFVQSRGVVEKPIPAVANHGSVDMKAPVVSGVVSSTNVDHPDVAQPTAVAADGSSSMTRGSPPGRNVPATASPVVTGPASAAKPGSALPAMATVSGSAVASPVAIGASTTMGIPGVANQPVSGGVSSSTPMDVSSGASPVAVSPGASGACSICPASSTSAAAPPTAASAVATDAEPTYAVEEPTALLRGGHLRSYQRAGLDWLAALYSKKLNGVLADDMGLGKTIMTIALFAHLALEHHLWGPHLIVVPTSVMLNWEIEFKRWCPGFKVISYFGNLKERRAKRRGWGLPNAVHVVITSYALAVADAVILRRMRWAYLVLDEAHHIKNFESLRWQTLVSFKSQRRLLLTGTPLQNSVMELWALLHFLMPDVFQSHTQFKEWFSVPLDSAATAKNTELVEPGGNRVHNPPDSLSRGGADLSNASTPGEAVAAGVVGRLHTVLRPFLLRRLKSDVEKGLPPKTEHVIRVSLSRRQRRLYEDFMARGDTAAALTGGDYLAVMNVLMQLRKVCNHPDLFDGRPIVSPFHVSALAVPVPRLVVGAAAYSSVYPASTQTPWDGHGSWSSEEDFPPSSFFADLSSSGQAFLAFGHPGVVARRFCGTDREPSVQFFMDECAGSGAHEGLQWLRRSSSSWLSPRLRQVNLDLIGEEVRGWSGEWQTAAASRLCDDAEAVAAADALSMVSFAPGAAELPTDSTEEHSALAVQSAGETFAFDAAMRSAAKKEAAFRKLVLLRHAALSRLRCQTRGIYGRDVRDIVTFPVGVVSRSWTAQAVGRWDSYSYLLLQLTRTWSEVAAGTHWLSEHYGTCITSAMAATPDMRYHHDTDERRRAAMDVRLVAADTQYLSQVTRPALVRSMVALPDARLVQWDCGKLQVLANLLRELKAGGHRVLIFTQMNRMLDILESFLSLHGHPYLRLDGTTPPENRQRLVSRFNGDSRVFVMILTTRSGGVGLNLVGADTVVFYDSDWNPAMDAQAQDRVHRIGQTRPVRVIRLVSASTVEENILRKASQKRSLESAVITEAQFTADNVRQRSGGRVDFLDLLSGAPAAAAVPGPGAAGESGAVGGVKVRDATGGPAPSPATSSGVSSPRAGAVVPKARVHPSTPLSTLIPSLSGAATAGVATSDSSGAALGGDPGAVSLLDDDETELLAVRIARKQERALAVDFPADEADLGTGSIVPTPTGVGFEGSTEDADPSEDAGKATEQALTPLQRFALQFVEAQSAGVSDGVDGVTAADEVREDDWQQGLSLEAMLARRSRGELELQDPCDGVVSDDDEDQAEVDVPDGLPRGGDGCSSNDEHANHSLVARDVRHVGDTTGESTGKLLRSTRVNTDSGNGLGRRTGNISGAAAADGRGGCTGHGGRAAGVGPHDPACVLQSAGATDVALPKPGAFSPNTHNNRSWVQASVCKDYEPHLPDSLYRDDTAPLTYVLSTPDKYQEQLAGALAEVASTRTPAWRVYGGLRTDCHPDELRVSAVVAGTAASGLECAEDAAFFPHAYSRLGRTPRATRRQREKAIAYANRQREAAAAAARAAAAREALAREALAREAAARESANRSSLSRDSAAADAVASTASPALGLATGGVASVAGAATASMRPIGRAGALVYRGGVPPGKIPIAGRGAAGAQKAHSSGGGAVVRTESAGTVPGTGTGRGAEANGMPNASGRAAAGAQPGVGGMKRPREKAGKVGAQPPGGRKVTGRKPRPPTKAQLARQAGSAAAAPPGGLLVPISGRQNWTREEEALLLQLVGQLGPNMQLVADALASHPLARAGVRRTRSCLECSVRYRVATSAAAHSRGDGQGGTPEVGSPSGSVSGGVPSVSARPASKQVPAGAAAGAKQQQQHAVNQAMQAAEALYEAPRVGDAEVLSRQLLALSSMASAPRYSKRTGDTRQSPAATPTLAPTHPSHATGSAKLLRFSTGAGSSSSIATATTAVPSASPAAGPHSRSGSDAGADAAGRAGSAGRPDVSFSVPLPGVIAASIRVSEHHKPGFKSTETTPAAIARRRRPFLRPLTDPHRAHLLARSAAAAAAPRTARGGTRGMPQAPSASAAGLAAAPGAKSASAPPSMARLHAGVISSGSSGLLPPKSAAPPAAKAAGGVGRGTGVGRGAPAGRGGVAGRGSVAGRGAAVGRGAVVGRGTPVARGGAVGRGSGGRGIAAGRGVGAGRGIPGHAVPPLAGTMGQGVPGALLRGGDAMAAATAGLPPKKRMKKALAGQGVVVPGLPHAAVRPPQAVPPGSAAGRGASLGVAATSHLAPAAYALNVNSRPTLGQPLGATTLPTGVPPPAVPSSPTVPGLPISAAPRPGGVTKKT